MPIDMPLWVVPGYIVRATAQHREAIAGARDARLHGHREVAAWWLTIAAIIRANIVHHRTRLQLSRDQTEPAQHRKV